MISNNIKIKSKKTQLSMLKWTRIFIQIAFFLAMPELFSQAFGGVKELVALMGKGQVLVMTVFVKRLLILLAVTLFAGRVFCGWACAFGAFGDWVFNIALVARKKLKIKLPKIPYKASIVLQKIKYIILVVIVAICFTGHSEWVTKVSPWTIFSLVRVGNFSFDKYIVSCGVLMLVIIGMAIKERFFCQFLCPLGAIFSLQLKIPIALLKRDSNNCITNCQACKNNCPASIKLNESEIADGECIVCGKCKVICPKKNIRLRA